MLRELAFMCQDLHFDKMRAEELLQYVDINQEFVDPQYGARTVLLDWAATWSNAEMAELLLKHGADPNQIFDDGTANALWNLQYADRDAPEENKRRLEIVKMLLKHGANPFLKIEENALYFSALMYHIEVDEGEQWDYREAFIALLEEYGA